MKKIKNSQPQTKFTGSYKKKSVAGLQIYISPSLMGEALLCFNLSACFL